MDGDEKGEMKMKYVKVSKDKVIEAIKTESLRPGCWIEPDWDKRDKVCHVCAVGAVMRAALSKDEDRLDEVCDHLSQCLFDPKIPVAGGFSFESRKQILDKAKEQLKQKKYLTTLSFLFETLCEFNSLLNGNSSYSISRHQIYRIKQTLIKFVEENFPKYIEVPVNGFKTKKGLKIIEK